MQDAAPIEALVGSLTPRRAHTVVGLWRRYAAARYSTELMAGRATRLVKELTRELADTRAEACEVQRQMEVQVHHLNHVVGRGPGGGLGAWTGYGMPWPRNFCYHR